MHLVGRISSASSWLIAYDKFNDDPGLRNLKYSLFSLQGCLGVTEDVYDNVIHVNPVLEEAIAVAQLILEFCEEF